MLVEGGRGKGGKHEIGKHNPGINKSYMGGIAQKGDYKEGGITFRT